MRVVRQESPEEVILIPGPPSFGPNFDVLEWPKDVVEVNDDPSPQTWQHVENQMIDVAPDLGDVGGVDEEDIARFELIE